MKENLVQVIRVDEDKCNNCHMCISVCPVKYCIDGSGEKVDLNHDLCIGCGSCITACQQNARLIVDDTEEAFTALRNREKIIAIAAPALIASYSRSWKNILGWLKSEGVEAIYDVSFGAELTVKSYLEYVEKENPKAVIAQPCPAIVSYLELYKPELLNRLAPADSPMLHTIKMIKNYYPEYRHHKVMVLSPCIAKKREFIETGLGDFNVTFKGLDDYIKNREIKLDRKEPADFDNPPAERAALFSSPGGLMNTVLRENPDLMDGIRKIEGPTEIYHYLDTLEESINSGMNPLLIDCLNCSKGCNGGTGTLMQDKSPDELEYYIRNRSNDLKKRYQTRLTGKTSVKMINRTLEPYWEPGLYSRSYHDYSDNNTIKTPNKGQLEEIYKKMLKESEDDFLNCAACGYNACESMATAIFNGLNREDNCHHYKHKMVEYEKDLINTINLELKTKIDSCDLLINKVTGTLEEVNQDVRAQSSSLEESSSSVEQMLNSFSNLSTTFSRQQDNLDNLITQAKTREDDMQKTSKAIGNITGNIRKIGELIEVIDDISQSTNLLSMNAAIEAAHAGDTGRGFAVVASEIKKLAENTASSARSAAESLENILTEADTTSSISEKTSASIITMIDEIRQLTQTVNQLLNDIQDMSSGSSIIISSLDTLKSHNRRVLGSSSQIVKNIGELAEKIKELAAISTEP